jgi:NTP pyrophosphatase (non-canonical NTP hydrolase)
MNIKLKVISHKEFQENKNQIEELVDKIWTKKENGDRCKFILNIWSDEKKQDYYFYILKNNKPIGITGFYPIDTKKGYFGLNHTGTLEKGTGKITFDLLVKIIKQIHPNAKTISEIIPYQREELVEIFEKWRFQRDFKDKYKQLEYKDNKGDNIYKYLMIRQIE